MVRMKAPAVKALPADAATSRSPEASTITEPMMACRPSFVSQMTPVAWPSSTMVLENQECVCRCTPASVTMSFDARLNASGLKAAAGQIPGGLVFECRW